MTKNVFVECPYDNKGTGAIKLQTRQKSAMKVS